jgi:hypothetical protein
LPSLASEVKANRHAAPADNPYRRAEKAASDVITAGLDLYRDLRDAAMEAWFFQIYGPAAILGAARQPAAAQQPAELSPRELPLVSDALAAIGKGGYPEAVALMGALIGRGAGRVPVARLELVERFVRDDEVLSGLPAETLRRIKAEQAVVAELEPERGLQSLPKLLAEPADRQRALSLLDEAVAAVPLTVQQQTTLDQVRAVLGADAAEFEPDQRGDASCKLAATIYNERTAHALTE